MIISELFTIVVYNTPTYSTVVYTTVSQELLIESTCIITSSTTMCYTTKSHEITTNIPDATNSIVVPTEGEVIELVQSDIDYSAPYL